MQGALLPRERRHTIMYVFSSSSRNSVPSIPTGDFVSRFTKVEYHPDYAYEEAIRIEYELVGEDGEKYAFSEVFYNMTKNKRTNQFFDYVEAAGVTYREDKPSVVAALAAKTAQGLYPEDLWG